MNEEALTTQEELAAEAIGLEAMRYLRGSETIQKIARETETKALEVLEEIRRVLNDDSLEDPQCFQRIDAIVRVLGDHGIYTRRHDW